MLDDIAIRRDCIVFKGVEGDYKLFMNAGQFEARDGAGDPVFYEGCWSLAVKDEGELSLLSTLGISRDMDAAAELIAECPYEFIHWFATRTLLSDGSYDFNRALSPDENVVFRRVLEFVDARTGEFYPTAAFYPAWDVKPAGEGLLPPKIATWAYYFDEQTEDWERSETYEARAATEGRCASVLE